LHENGNLWLIPWDSAPALASLAPKRKPAVLRPLAPAWPWSSWPASSEPHEVRACIEISAPQEPAPESCSFWRSWRRLPREAWPLAWVLKVDAEDGPYQASEGDALWAACRQVWGTLVPRMPIVAPGPKARSDLASRRSQRAREKHRRPQPPADLIDAWRLDWTWASPLPHAASATVRLGWSLLHAKGHHYLRPRRQSARLLLL
jgi:hypothetical protein